MCVCDVRVRDVCILNMCSPLAAWNSSLSDYGHSDLQHHEQQQSKSSKWPKNRALQYQLND